MSYKGIRWLVIALYLIVGVVIAWDHGYLGLGWLRGHAHPASLVAVESTLIYAIDRPSLLASRLFQQDHVVEAKVAPDNKGLLLRTKDADAFYLLLNRVILDSALVVESVAPADDDVNSVYQYLIGGEGGTV